MPAPAIARPTRQGVAPEENRRTATETGVRRKAGPAAESPTRESYIREVSKTDRASYRPPAPPAGPTARNNVAPKPLKKAEPVKAKGVVPKASLASIPPKATTPPAAKASVPPPKAKLPSVPPPKAKLSSMPPPAPAATPSSPPPVPADAKRSSMPPPAPQAPAVAQAPAPPLIPAEAVRANMPPPPPAPEAPASTSHVLASAPPLAFPEADEPVDFAAIGVRRSIVPEPLAKVASDVRGSLAPAGRAEAKRELRSMLIAALQGTRRLLDRLAEITVNLELRLRG